MNVDYTDYLESLEDDLTRLRMFYLRIAQHVGEMYGGKQNSLAATLLDHYIRGGGALFKFDPRFLKGDSAVRTYLRDEVRNVFLSRKKAADGNGSKWGGVIPRLLAQQAPNAIHEMAYTGPSVVLERDLLAYVEKFAGQVAGGRFRADKHGDLVASLNVFAITTKVRARVRPKKKSVHRVEFKEWTSVAWDKYDFEKKKYFPVPNPDYGSSKPFAVAPKRPYVIIRHKYAHLLEDAGLAHPFKVESKPWNAVGESWAQPADVDTSRCRVLGQWVSCDPYEGVSTEPTRVKVNVGAG